MTVHTIRGAFRDLNCKGKGEETFRKVWRGGQWQWVSGPLPRGTFLAADRHASSKGDVETGELVGQFGRQLPNRKCDLEAFWIVTDHDGAPKLVKAEYTKPRLGVYAVAMPDGVIEVSSPLDR